VAVLNEPKDEHDRLRLFVVGRDGNSEEWLDVGGLYSGVTRLQLAWSPDGRYLAIAPLDLDSPFLVLDTTTRQLLDFCVPGNALNAHILWSPDSSQVIIPR